MSNVNSHFSMRVWHVLCVLYTLDLNKTNSFPKTQNYMEIISTPTLLHEAVLHHHAKYYDGVVTAP
jgi:hypothetical protein